MSSKLPNDILEPDRRRVVYARSMLELAYSAPRIERWNNSVPKQSSFFTPMRDLLEPDAGYSVVVGKVNETRTRRILCSRT